MARMVEMVIAGKVPDAVLKSAAAGQLSLPAPEMIETLVFLVAHFLHGNTARNTLATWDAEQLKSIVADPNTRSYVLNYFLVPKNRRMEIMPALIENPSTSSESLKIIADTATRDMVDIFLHSERTKKLSDVLLSLMSNKLLLPEEYEQLRDALERSGASVPAAGLIYDHSAELWIMEHEAEIAAQEGKQLELVGGMEALEEELAAAPAEVKAERVSVTQKLAKMNVSGRVKTAMLGSKEERTILIRDSSRIVTDAVLASSKLSESEAEAIATMKNVTEAVLRTMMRTRKFMKNYNIIRNLCNNPRMPLELSLGLMKNLHVIDLKLLSANKGVPETIRKLALKDFKEKSKKK